MEYDDETLAAVDAWMERAASGLPPDRLLRTFEHAFAAVWRRAHRTLGEVTLLAIIHRVLHDASARFPSLSSLEADATTGLSCEKLQARASSLASKPLAEAMRFVMVEFLSVLGTLTAEILTPALLAELSSLGPEEKRPTESESPVEPSSQSIEDAKS